MIHIRRFGSEVARKCSASRVFGDKWAILGRERGKKTRGGVSGLRAIAITDDATGFAAITSTLASGRLIYRVEIWTIEAPAQAGADR